MKFLNDLLPIFTKHNLSFVSRRHEIDDVHTFTFKSNREYNWKPGQHGLFTIPGHKLEGGSYRGFSLASTPNEKIIMISTRITDKPSAFKQVLLNLKQGDTISMRGPFGPFYIDEPSRPAVCIAGGIGITPYRSLISAAAVSNNILSATPIDLLYIDSRKTFVFKGYFDSLLEDNELIKIQYLSDKEEFAKEMNALIERLNNKAVYYLSGPPGMIKQLKEKLISQGIKKSNIRHEMFLGY